MMFHGLSSKIRFLIHGARLRQEVACACRLHHPRGAGCSVPETDLCRKRNARLAWASAIDLPRTAQKDADVVSTGMNTTDSATLSGMITSKVPFPSASTAGQPQS